MAVQELGDALMEVKGAIEDVYNSKTLKQVLGTLLSIGNFLNGTQVTFYLPSCAAHYFFFNYDCGVKTF